MSVQWLLNWWNLIFLMPFGLALLYLALYISSGITFGDTDADADFDADADVDAELDGDIDHDVDADGDVDNDMDADADHDVDGDHEAAVQGESGSGQQAGGIIHAFNWIGIGRVPASLVLMVLMLVWGVSGMLCNSAMVGKGAAAAWISIPVAAALSLIITHYLALFIDRYMPMCDTSAIRRHALLGSVGEAIYAIDQKFGMVSVRDDQGDLYQMPCRAESAADEVSKGSKVQLVAYNAKQGLFFVKRVDAGNPAPLNQTAH